MIRSEIMITIPIMISEGSTPQFRFKNVNDQFSSILSSLSTSINFIRSSSTFSFIQNLNDQTINMLQSFASYNLCDLFCALNGSSQNYYIHIQFLQQGIMRVRRQPNPDQRIIILKMETWKKILYALFISILCFAITKGDPKHSTLLKNIEITDEKIEYILETTIAMHTKKIRQRITQQHQGIWKTIASYIKSPKWAELEVELKTRIGIRLNSITYDKATNNVHIDFGQPCVLDRSYTTKFIQSSDNFFSKWSISSFEEHKDNFLKQLIDSESNSLVDIFKKDSKSLRQLEGEYYNKVLASLNTRYYELDPTILVWKLNQYILNLINRVKPEGILPSINSSYLYTKQISNKPHQPQKQILPIGASDNTKKAWRNQKDLNKKGKIEYQYRYNQKQRSQRQKIKMKLKEKN